MASRDTTKSLARAKYQQNRTADSAHLAALVSNVGAWGIRTFAVFLDTKNNYFLDYFVFSQTKNWLRDIINLKPIVK